MTIDRKIREEVLEAILKAGSDGSTITEIEKKTKFERHTLSKYLIIMAAHGLIYFKQFGKAKVWYVNKVPLQKTLDPTHNTKSVGETFLSNILSHLPYGLVVIDLDHNILFASNNLTERYGDLGNKKFYSSILGNQNPPSLKKLEQLFKGNLNLVEFKLGDKEGRILNIKASRVTNPDKTTSFALIIDDITERIKSQEELFERKSLLESERAALNESAIVAETDLQGRITYVNDKFVEISGYSAEELLGKDHRIINSGYHSKSFFKNMWLTISSGKVWKGIIRNKAKNGSFYWVDSSIAPILGKNGKPVKYLAIRFDITKWLDKKG